MGTTILQRHHNPISSTNFPNRRPRRRRANSGSSQSWPRNRRDRATVPDCPPKTLVSGPVKILKRGEPLAPFIRKTEDCDLSLCSTKRLGPDPDIVREQVRIPDPSSYAYAGSGIYVSSPPPSSVPVPVFLSKIGTTTRDFQRLLRLDLA